MNGAKLKLALPMGEDFRPPPNRMAGATEWNMEDFPEPDDSKPVTFLADCPPRLWTRRSGRLRRFSERILANSLIDGLRERITRNPDNGLGSRSSVQMDGWPTSM
jgi:hypothetical protein